RVDVEATAPARGPQQTLSRGTESLRVGRGRPWRPERPFDNKAHDSGWPSAGRGARRFRELRQTKAAAVTATTASPRRYGIAATVKSARRAESTDVVAYLRSESRLYTMRGRASGPHRNRDPGGSIRRVPTSVDDRRLPGSPRICDVDDLCQVPVHESYVNVVRAINREGDRPSADPAVCSIVSLCQPAPSRTA